MVICICLNVDKLNQIVILLNILGNKLRKHEVNIYRNKYLLLLILTRFGLQNIKEHVRYKILLFSCNYVMQHFLYSFAYKHNQCIAVAQQ